MNKTVLLFLVSCLTGIAAEQCPVKKFNELGYGTLSGRVQSLSMYRDYEGVGNGYSTTLGWKLDYLTPEWAGWSAGLSFLHVDVLHTAGGRFGRNGEGLLFNGRVNELNEAWVQYHFGTLGASNTFVKAGRQVINGEVFRADEFRQKPRAFEAVVFTTKDIKDVSLTVGHADRLSNVWDSDSSGDRLNWRYKDIEDVLGVNYGTRGVTWIEGVYTGIENIELAAYDAYAHDILNVAGGRIKCRLSGTTALNGYYRHETDVGRGASLSSDMVGASIEQKAGGVTFEPGFLSVSGDNLVFSELYTGINHPLGSSMMIYSGQFNGGADTAYLKAVTKIDKTVLYMLYNYTWHEKTAFDAQELNVVVKQSLTERLSVALKVGAGYRDGDAPGGDDTFATDTRLFVTYTF